MRKEAQSITRISVLNDQHLYMQTQENFEILNFVNLLIFCNFHRSLAAGYLV